MSQKFTAKPGAQITIEITRQTPAKSSPAQNGRPRSLIETRREEDYQARRKSGGILIYDLGMTETANIYSDLDSTLLKPYTNTGGGGLPFPLPLDNADFAVRDALILANLETAAQIKPKYTAHIAGSIAFDDTDSVTMQEETSLWTNKGVKVTAAQAAANVISIYFASVNGVQDYFFEPLVLGGSGGDKITNIYDFTAAAVSFRLSVKAKIYLVPRYVHSFKDEFLDNRPGFYQIVHQLNSFWLFFPRALMVEGGLAYYQVDSKLLPHSRVMRSTQTQFQGTFTNTELSASAFEGSGVNAIFRTSADDTRSGFLKAIIKQGEETFYVWKS